jgi:hypothetical protein
LLGWHSVSVRNESFGQRFAHRATQLFSYLRRFSVNRAIHRASAHDRNAEKKCCISSDKFLHKSVILCSKEDTIVSKTRRMRYNTNHRPGPRKRRPEEPSDAVVRSVAVAVVESFVERAFCPTIVQALKNADHYGSMRPWTVVEKHRGEMKGREKVSFSRKKGNNCRRFRCSPTPREDPRCRHQMSPPPSHRPSPRSVVASFRPAIRGGAVVDAIERAFRPTIFGAFAAHRIRR